MSIRPLFPAVEPATVKSETIPIESQPLQPIIHAEITPGDDSVFEGSFTEPFFGNKFNGIIDVYNWVQAEGIEGVEVPLPKGISHSDVELFFTMLEPEILEEWNQLATWMGQRSVKNADFFKEPQVIRQLSLIRGRIKQCLKRKACQGFLREQLGGWLQEIKEKGAYLMTRSSSVEDSKNCANAGKNLSLHYIHPELEDVLVSAGEVVASYFHEVSLSNRMENGSNPFEEPLVLSVILHELIGERVLSSESEGAYADSIPVSAVIFTTEPDYSEEGFAVTKISATLGHGEGVVNNEEVATDTVFVVASTSDPTGFVEVYKKKQKPVRLAPVKEENRVELKCVKNPLAKIHGRALDKKMVERLFHLAKRYEAYKGYPIDMEIVIKDEVIYVVQARPVVRVEAQPTYLSEQKIEQLPHNPVIQTIYSEILVPGKGSVAVIDSKEQVLIATSLKEADNTGIFNKELHRVVIAGQEEPENSHPIANFGGRGTICLYNPNLSEIESCVKRVDTSTSLLFCPQNGRMSLWNRAIDPALCIAEGYFSHPADLRPSLDVPPQKPLGLSKEAALPEEIRLLIRALKEATTTQIALEIIHQIKTLPLVANLNHQIQKLKASDVTGKALEILTLLSSLQKELSATLEELEASYQTSQPRLCSLFHIKTLTSLLGNTTQNVEASYSLLHVEPFAKRAENLINYRKQLAFPPQLEGLLWIGECAIDQERGKEWERFLVQLEEALQAQRLLPDEKEKLEYVLGRLEQLNILPMWFNAFFLPSIAPLDWRSSYEKIIECKADLTHPDFYLLMNVHGEFIRLTDALPSFQDPKKFSPLWEQLKRLSSDLLTEKQIKAFHGRSLFFQAVHTQLLNESVTLIDLAIKKMLSSHQFFAMERVQKLSLMYTHNYELTKRWICDLITDRRMQLSDDWPLSRYFNKIEDIENRIDIGWDITNLDPSPHFSVQAMCLSSNAQYNRHQPQTLADLFTLNHQNQLFALSLMTQWFCPVAKLPLPSFVQEAHKALLTLPCSNREIKPPFFLGLDLAFQEVELHYNIALRNHSAIIDLNYNCSTPGVTVTVKLFGEARGRWAAIVRWLQAMSHGNLLKLKKAPEFTKQELQFSWTISEASTFSALESELTAILHYTMEINQDDIKSAFYYRMQNDYPEEMELAVGEWFFQNARKSHWNAYPLIVSYLLSPKGEIELAKCLHACTTPEEIETQLKYFNILLELRYQCANIEPILKTLKEAIFLHLPKYIQQSIHIKKCYEILFFLRMEQRAREIAADWIKQVENQEEPNLVFRDQLREITTWQIGRIRGRRTQQQNGSNGS